MLHRVLNQAIGRRSVRQVVQRQTMLSREPVIPAGHCRPLGPRPAMDMEEGHRVREPCAPDIDAQGIQNVVPNTDARRAVETTSWAHFAPGWSPANLCLPRLDAMVLVTTVPEWPGFLVHRECSDTEVLADPSNVQRRRVDAHDKGLCVGNTSRLAAT